MKWICDIGSNHNKNFARTLSIMKIAKEIGCWGVKFQLFTADTLYREGSISELRRNAIRQNELPRGWVPNLCQVARDLDLRIGFTPFDHCAVDLMKHNKDMIAFAKIGSYELLWIKLISSVTNLGIPMIMSTGMGTNSEIDRAIRVALATRLNYNLLELLHCNSQYPADPKDCDVTRISELQTRYDCPVGWSDHTGRPGVIFAAVAAGANTIEFHLDLDGDGREFAHGHVWLPHEIQAVIDDVEDFKHAHLRGATHSDLRSQRTDPIDGMRPIIATWDDN